MHKLSLGGAEVVREPSISVHRGISFELRDSFSHVGHLTRLVLPVSVILTCKFGKPNRFVVFLVQANVLVQILPLACVTVHSDGVYTAPSARRKKLIQPLDWAQPSAESHGRTNQNRNVLAACDLLYLGPQSSGCLRGYVGLVRMIGLVK